MKKFITTSALFILFLVVSASAQETIAIDNSNITGKTLILSNDFLGQKPEVKQNRVYLAVNWVDQIGSDAEKSKESKLRRALVSQWEKEGFTFLKLVDNPKGQKPGRYILMIK